MLNKELHLNEKVFDKDVEKQPTRQGYGDGLVALGEMHSNVVALSADVADSTKAGAFAKAYPERFFNCGVAEQNMAAVAAGLAVSGKVAFISSYATFSPGKNWETLRTTAVYNRADVKIAGHHTGIATGPDGPTHQATEDIASLRPWPGMQIVVPCDALEGRRATIAAGETDGPFYLRFTREKTQMITTEKTPFHFGKVEEYWTCEKPEAVIFATGYMVYYALFAAKKLTAKNIPVVVANVATIKPFDVNTVVKLAKRAGRVVTCEDHQTAGGLYGAVCETLAAHHPVPVESVSLRDTFAESGSFEELLKKYKMDDDAIVAACEKVIKRSL